MNNLDKTTSSAAQPQKGLLERFSDLFWRINCFLVGFPAFDYLKTLDWDDKAKILRNAVAMVIPPTVFTLSLLYFGPILLSEESIHTMLVLPVIVFLVDWEITSNKWSGRASTLSVRLARYSVTIIALLFAIVAALAPEKINLQKSLLEHETEVALKTPEIKARYDLYSQQIVGYQEIILENDKRFQERVALAQKFAFNNRLAYLEEHGPRGIDKETGIYITGGGCGKDCKNYRMQADATKVLIDELDAIPVKNEALRKKIQDTTSEQQELFSSKRSDQNSIGSQISAIPHADPGVLLIIVLWFIAILAADLIALNLAGGEVSNTILEAVTAHKKVVSDAVIEKEKADKLEVSYLSKQKIAEIHAKHKVIRDKLSENFPTVNVVQLSSRRSKSETV